MNPDRRLGQRWSLAQRLKNDAIYGLLRSADTLARRLPTPWTRGLLTAVARVVMRRSAVARDNVARVFPAWSGDQHRALLALHAQRLAVHASAALEVAWGHRASQPLPFLDESLGVLQEALAEGRGVILATAHLGSWERLAQTLLQAGLPLTAIAREPYDPRLAAWLTALRGALPTIPRSAPGAARAMVRCLRNGGILLIPMDLATRGVETHPCSFLGRSTAIVTGPARLALHTGAAVVVATYTRRETQEGIHVERVAPPARGPQATHDLTEQLAAALTRAVLQCPEEWLWLHPRWTASGPSPLYSTHDGREAHRS